MSNEVAGWRTRVGGSRTTVSAFAACFLVAGSFAVAKAEPQAPSKFVVTNATDDIISESSCNDAGTGTTCTLRAAVAAANANGDASTVEFALGAADGGNIISLDAALPALSADITISGPAARGVTIQRSTAVNTPNFRIFAIAAGVTADFSNLTIANGRLVSPGGSATGGGIQNYGTKLALTNCTVRDNFVGGDLGTNAGGGIINGNNAPSASGSELVLVNSTFSGNTVQCSSGVGYGAGGGAIANSNGTISLLNCTVSGNTATASNGSGADAGGIANDSMTVSAKNTIVAGNVSSGDSQYADQYRLTDNGGNVINVDPKLGALQDNGGPAFTMLPAVDSPALNGGSATGAPATDQRGIARPQGGDFDSGAVERKAPTATPVASFTVPQNVLKTITFAGSNPESGALSYVITALPTRGTLFDGVGTATPISTVPYTLTDAQHRVTFKSETAGTGEFTFVVGAGVVASDAQTVNFAVSDSAAPTIGITSPADKSFVATLTSIRGVAADNIGIARVDLYLQRQSDNKFWNGSAWAPFSGTGTKLSTALSSTPNGVAWARTSGLPSGSALPPGPYFIAARAVDTSGNGTSASAIINVDVQRPVVSIQSPANNAIIATSPVINGFASDTPGGSGINRVTLVLRRNSNGDYWNGTQWAGKTAIAFSTALTGTSWKRLGALPVVATTDPTKKLTDGGYTVAVAAYDRAGNLSAIPANNFIVDTQAPFIAITSPATSATSLASVSGTASDNTGVVRVDLYLQRKSDNKYWNGASWVAPVTALSTVLTGAAPRQWTRNSGLPTGANLLPGAYFTAARAFDAAGNGTSATRNFMVSANANLAKTASPVALSSATASGKGTIRLSFNGALDASASDAANYALNNGDTAIVSVSQPDASTVEINAGALASGARIAVAYELQDVQGCSLKGLANVVVK